MASRALRRPRSPRARNKWIPLTPAIRLFIVRLPFRFHLQQTLPAHLFSADEHPRISSQGIARKLRGGHPAGRRRHRRPRRRRRVARALGTNNLVVKAQIHAGGRGKGTFKNGFKGGVHLCKTAGQVRDIAEQDAGRRHSSPTRPDRTDAKVNKVLVVHLRRDRTRALLCDH